jgi:hypothetical protein
VGEFNGAVICMMRNLEIERVSNLLLIEKVSLSFIILLLIFDR